MRPWTRLQDWGTLVAGLYAALSPIWVNTTGERDALAALRRPEVRARLHDLGGAA